MKKPKEKAKTSPAVPKKNVKSQTGKDIAQQSEEDVEYIPLLERVRRESEALEKVGGPGEGRKREVARMAFGLWLSLPVRYRGAPEGVLTQLGLEGDMLELARIDSVGKFGEVCSVGHSALAAWRKEFDSSEQGQDHRKFFVKLMREGLGALYRNLIVNGKAEDFKVFAQYVEGWMPGIALGAPGDVNTVDPERKKGLDNLLAGNSLKP